MRVRFLISQGPLLPILVSPGFEKKDLATYRLELLIKCGKSCRYCSTNSGYQARVHGKERDQAAFDQLGAQMKVACEPQLAVWDPLVLDKLMAQLDAEAPEFGFGHTLMFSQFTDPFSEPVLSLGITWHALELVLDRTMFRVRVLTKNACVGSKKWIELFLKYPDRIVVGLSIGTLDDEWAKRMEVGTSPPSARVRAHHRLQDAGVPTFGMLCPMFPEVLEGDHLERLVEAIRPHLCEEVWAEPYNNRVNWEQVRAAYEPGTAEYEWMTDVFEQGNVAAWSKYATELYVRILVIAKRGGWTHKLKYLLYESDIVAADASSFASLEGVLLQSKPTNDGRSKNPHIAKLQAAQEDPTS